MYRRCVDDLTDREGAESQERPRSQGEEKRKGAERSVRGRVPTDPRRKERGKERKVKADL